MNDPIYTGRPDIKCPRVSRHGVYGQKVITRIWKVRFENKSRSKLLHGFWSRNQRIGKSERFHYRT
jgi:hypothetical protein